MIGGNAVTQREPMPQEPDECTHFVVIPPDERRFDDPALQKKIQDELNQAFPSRRFTVTTEGPGRYEDFFVIPVLGEVGSTGSPLASYPSMETVQELATFLYRYVSEEAPVKPTLQ